MEKLKKGIYRHYKGNKYLVLTEAINKETKEEMVIYQDLKSKQTWCRNKQEFLEKVIIKDEKKARFKLEEEQDTWESKYLRALADYQNLIKQSKKDKEDFVKYAVFDFLQELLPIYDHLKLSLKGLNDQEKNNAWAIGVRHVLKQFKDLLESKGVEEIETEGKEFDHNNMEALEGEGNVVIKEVIPGYKLHSRLIRPAKVIVGSKKDK